MSRRFNIQDTVTHATHGAGTIGSIGSTSKRVDGKFVTGDYKYMVKFESGEIRQFPIESDELVSDPKRRKVTHW